MTGIKNSANSEWDRMAVAILNARDDLRNLPAKIDAVLDAPEAARELLCTIRSMAEAQASQLQWALKHPQTREEPRWRTRS